MGVCVVGSSSFGFGFGFGLTVRVYFAGGTETNLGRELVLVLVLPCGSV